MYKIEVIYDTGDSFHRETNVRRIIDEIYWDSLDAAKQALKDIEAHYAAYKQIRYEYDMDDEDIKKVLDKAKKSPWYCHDKSYGLERHGFVSSLILLANDDGTREKLYCFWTGYFESLVGCDIVEDKGELSFRV